MPRSTDRLTRHLMIRGRVQGVGFRWALSAQAKALGLCGWVRNRCDGSLEALVSGPVDAVEALTVWAHRGPPSAHVNGVTISDQAGAAEVVSGFSQRATL